MTKLQFSRNGGFDEVVAENAGIHIERMSPKHIWLTVAGSDGKSLTIDLKTVFGGAIQASIINDGFTVRGTPGDRVNYTVARDPMEVLDVAINGPKPEHKTKTMTSRVARGLAAFFSVMSMILVLDVLFTGIALMTHTNHGEILTRGIIVAGVSVAVMALVAGIVMHLSAREHKEEVAFANASGI